MGAVDRAADDGHGNVHRTAQLSRPRVSVILPCRDAAATIEASLASLDAQSFRDFETVAIDDGSADSTGEILENEARRNPHLRVIHGEARGIVGALNTGIDAARGGLLARMDADDIARPERLLRQVALLDTRPDVAACGAGIRYFPRRALKDGTRRYEAWVNGVVDGATIDRDLFVECPVPHPTLLIRRSALEAVGGYRDPGWPEDYDLVLRLRAAGLAIEKVADVLVEWREHPQRLSRNHPRYSDAAFRRCKVEFLLRTHLRDRRSVVIWGSGPVGKAMARELIGRGIRVDAFVDLDPRKIGQTIHGAPVIDPGGIGAFGGTYTLAAVAGAGPREEIRTALRSAGRVELQDFCAVA